MSGIPILVIAAVVLVFVLPVLWRGSVARSQNRDLRRNQAEADRLILQAEMQVQMGQLDSAAALYSRATALAFGNPLLMSEAHYGLFRVAERRCDWQGAIHQIDAALSYAPDWRQYKPNFEGLLQGAKQRVVARIGQ